MKLRILVAFNEYLGCTGQPKFDDHDPDVFARSFARHLLTAEEEKVFQFENVTWYYIGEYDDESMEMIPEKSPVKILDCNKVLEERKIKAKLLEAAKEREKENVGKD